ncbi:tRNA cyclic N6-threonylcarbamoyladenosine(37) synthase TcdA [Chitinibacter bivalviorum]|uniref:tRNA threonylcarbamoyladenosine dehydratase n=1 Tax=Chitinibacter bivalviorum TaxID=2739434 RepID=A0A7H9BGJ5_9NEIS|nr:tRNA cyclic N6-threonylcarbamoyladenosine(37) synthase TcdA [Chitinibacter bivalviorum]QLG87727.1 tRNA cyclic N6-threonylcarbamoyladenosine(37) synthase TcdA [Chitinibacter bivalviorum]
MEQENNYQRRFAGVARLYGAAGLAKFASAKVCVIGIGGVGSWVAEGLARSGVGGVTLIDLDDICISNTNRQLPALEGQFGRMKVAAVAERLLAINPEIAIRAIEDFVAEENFTQYLNGHDYIIDCIDSVKTKAALIAYCRRNKIKIITVGGAGGQIDPTQIKVDDLSKTIQDPLAAKVRNLLRRDFGFAKNGKKMGVECVYSTEQLMYPQADGSVCAAKPQSGEGVRLDCAGGFGAVMTVTATFGLVAVSRVLKSLSK